ncbi:MULTISPECIES: D-alanyl-D-alanine carboxypeptidase/D-alanyl-D-alanine endopeptidase [Cyanophyceae]|uniref:D-alanyl-D-alanine carboxypeptidase/D-alanyl-D-alanine-endopeptidase n=1 Tax=Leptolyngbya subtilissima DQ-A4 TaxID=2933933 RepID=A0ABV0JXJ4_9CYAN|nr:D-alanyl-D-alanine carboxypeptidase/D-alanyl-D-alanine-endopeptidase [Nodosilinea sp. FACHB-141]MBD2111884.1 D-alanyl-D-alanine carboxypeptidase/D-alanyl-D-alanine-endopeptidase [Nodosilinea sp. FACHB-141]
MVKLPRIESVGLGIALGLLSTTFPTAAAFAALCPAQLTTQLDSAFSQPPLDQAYTGMVLQTQGQNRRTLYNRNGDRLFTPASNIKLLTTAAAAHQLGGYYRLRTSVYGTPGPGGSTALRVVGRGDPSLTTAQIDSLVQQLTQAGVNQVSRLTIDDSYFPGFATNPTWEWEDAQFAYAAPVNSLIFNRNAIALQLSPTQVGSPLAVVWPQPLPADSLPVANNSTTVAAGAPATPLALWRTGDSPTIRLTGQLTQGSSSQTLNLAVLNPAQQFAAAMEQALQRQSVAVGQTVIVQTPAPIADSELAAVESPSVRELMVLANRDSDNLYAEALFKTLGVTAGGNITEGDDVAEASQAGGEAVRAALAEIGVDATALRLADGSGLSRHNLVSPIALVETLQVMTTHPQGAVFRDSLAIAGRSGTLSNRLRGTVLEGRLQGKSGALTGNVALSGYVQPPNYEPLVFSLLINHSNQSATVLRQKIDQLLLLVAQLEEGC